MDLLSIINNNIINILLYKYLSRGSSTLAVASGAGQCRGDEVLRNLNSQTKILQQVQGAGHRPLAGDSRSHNWCKGTGGTAPWQATQNLSTGTGDWGHRLLVGDSRSHNRYRGTGRFNTPASDSRSHNRCRGTRGRWPLAVVSRSHNWCRGSGGCNPPAGNSRSHNRCRGTMGRCPWQATRLFCLFKNMRYFRN